MNSHLALTETATLPKNLPTPQYLIRDSEAQYKIVLDMINADQSRVYAYVGCDQTKLYVTAKTEMDQYTAKFLWIFSLPDNSLPNQITLERRKDYFVIEVPKKRMQTINYTRSWNQAQLSEAI